MTYSILIVDDDLDTITLIGLMLQRRGFEVHKVQSGTEVFSFLAHTMPDLVLLDVMMPGMDGYEVCRRIKTNPVLNHLPVIMLSARAQPASQMEGFRAGAIDYITKPISSANLVTRLQVALERYTHDSKLATSPCVAEFALGDKTS
jgi:CheY-like chemotaxis protein